MIEKEPRKKTFWAIWVFYLLIAFEIIYMISPFGLYYYSVYGKGLNFLNNNPATVWLAGFFLPHIAETSSLILNNYKDVGWTLAVIGFISFCIGAGQIYYNKFARKKAVTGGIYNFIRHPQYVSLSICSFGLLLVWPRYLVMVMFINMLFIYYFLAKAEENECEGKFGKSYTEYKIRTHMFLPFKIPSADKLLELPKSGIKRYAVIATIYLTIISTSVVLANRLKIYSVGKLYTLYSDNSATISLAKTEGDTLEKIIEIALKNTNVQKILASAGNNSNTKYLNYVLPSEWYIPDIPMNNSKKIIRGHDTPGNYNKNLFKVLFMQAVLKSKTINAEQNKIILNTIKRKPVIEVEVELNQNRVVQIENPPETVMWGNIPTPLF